MGINRGVIAGVVLLMSMAVVMCQAENKNKCKLVAEKPTRTWNETETFVSHSFDSMGKFNAYLIYHEKEPSENIYMPLTMNSVGTEGNNRMVFGFDCSTVKLLMRYDISGYQIIYYAFVYIHLPSWGHTRCEIQGGMTDIKFKDGTHYVCTKEMKFECFAEDKIWLHVADLVIEGLEFENLGVRKNYMNHKYTYPAAPCYT